MLNEVNVIRIPAQLTMRNVQKFNSNAILSDTIDANVEVITVIASLVERTKQLNMETIVIGDETVKRTN